MTSTKVAIGGDAQAVAGMLLNVPASSTNGFSFQTAGVTVAQITNAGALIANGNSTINGTLTVTGAGSFGADLKAKPTINSVAVSSWVTPLYTDATGTTAASTAHEEFGVTGSISGGGTATITLTNNAVFASASSYSVQVTQNDGSTTNVGVPVVTYSSGSSFIIKNTGTGSHTFAWYAVGT